MSWLLRGYAEKGDYRISLNVAKPYKDFKQVCICLHKKKQIGKTDSLKKAVFICEKHGEKK